MNTDFHKLRHALWTLAAALIVWSLAGCTVTTNNPNMVRGSGNVITEPRQVSRLSEVVLTISGDLIINEDGTEALTIEGEDNITPLITTEVKNNRLTIGTGQSTSFSNTKPLRFHLSVKSLSYICATGSGNISAQGINSNELKIETTGSGNITAKNISAENFLHRHEFRFR